MNQSTPKGLRLHIGLFGRRNVGKSSLLNAVTRASQEVADYDRATELERLGGKIMTLDSKEWRELAVAA